MDFDGIVSLDFKAALTNQPTARPTRVPTKRPTAKPSLAPTLAPSVRGETNGPSSHPSRAPTVLPTSRPTESPTESNTGTYISFSSTVTMSGVDYTQFAADSLAQQAALDTTRSTMDPNIDSDEIVIGAAGSGSASATSSLRNHQLGRAAKAGAQSGVSTWVRYEVNANINNLGFADTTTAYSTLTNNLQLSISSGNYTTVLVSTATSMGTETMSNADVSESAVVSNYTSYDVQTDAASSGSDPSVSPGLIVGPLLGALVVGVVALLIYRRIKGFSAEEKDALWKETSVSRSSSVISPSARNSRISRITFTSKDDANQLESSSVNPLHDGSSNAGKEVPFVSESGL